MNFYWDLQKNKLIKNDDNMNKIDIYNGYDCLLE